MRRLSRVLLSLAALAALLPAQPYGRPAGLRNIGIDQRLGATVPLDATFSDETGKPVRLADLFHGRPVVLSLAYYRCPMLCNMVLNAELHAMRNVSLQLGRDFDAVTVSFDPAEGPALALAKKATYTDRLGNAEGARAWRFLTGREAEIRELAAAVGFRYAWDPQTAQWAHASGIMVLTPDGKVARYLFGIDYPKQDLRLALVEASANKIGTPADQLLLFCFHYDPAKGRYGIAIQNALKIAGSATALALGAFVITMVRRDYNGGRRA